MRVVSGAQLIAFGVVGSRLRHGMRRLPAVRPEFRCAPSVSVVVPARNEATRIAACLNAINDSMKPNELIVVDDSSTDDTALVASALGARVVTAPPLPDGWVGKPWALQQGLLATTSDVVIFLDADVWARPGLQGALVAELAEFEIVSFAARIVSASPLEQAIHASMLTTLVYRFGPVGRRTQPSVDRIMGNGQCLAVNREWLVNRGGFTLAASNMTDDIAILRALALRGARIGFLDGSKVVDVRMYDTAAETWREWPRSLPMADVTPTATRLFDLATLWLTLVLPVVKLALGRATRLDKALLTQRVLIGAATSRAYRAPRTGILFAPLLDVPVVMRLTKTAVRPVRVWRGRSYTQQGTADR